MNPLEKLLKRMGVKRYEDLNQEEKETYKEWESSLSGRTITQDDYRKFLELELNQSIHRLTDIDLSKEAEIFRKVEVRMIKKIIGFLDMPLVEKDILSKQIESRL